MNKLEHILLLLFTMALTSTTYATDYEVSGAGTIDANGTYVENGTHDGKPKYEKDGWVLYYHSMCSYWKIGTLTDDCPKYKNSSNSDTPPSTGWEIIYGSSPAPTVSEASGLIYSTDTFIESSDNDGTIGNTITIDYASPDADYFTGSNGFFPLVSTRLPMYLMA